MIKTITTKSFIVLCTIFMSQKLAQAAEATYVSMSNDLDNIAVQNEIDTLCKRIKSIIIHYEPTVTDADLEFAKYTSSHFQDFFPADTSSLTPEEKQKIAYQSIGQINRYHQGGNWPFGLISKLIEELEHDEDVLAQYKQYIKAILTQMDTEQKFPLNTDKALRIAFLDKYSKEFKQLSLEEKKAFSRYGLNLKILDMFQSSPNKVERAFMAITNNDDPHYIVTDMCLAFHRWFLTTTLVSVIICVFMQHLGPLALDQVFVATGALLLSPNVFFGLRNTILHLQKRT